MGFKEYWGNHFGNPRGIGGKIATFIMNRMNKAMYKAVMREVKNNTNILEIGFGNGFLLKKLLRKSSSRFYGIDISKDMIKSALKRNKVYVKNGRLSLSEASVENIPFDVKFGQIYTINTTYFWDNLKDGLREVFDKLDDGGEFLIVCYTKQWLENRNKFTENYKKYTEHEYLEMAERVGFRAELVHIKKGVSFYIRAVK